jgi:hypothetical protein
MSSGSSGRTHAWQQQGVTSDADGEGKECQPEPDGDGGTSGYAVVEGFAADNTLGF